MEIQRQKYTNAQRTERESHFKGVKEIIERKKERERNRKRKRKMKEKKCDMERGWGLKKR